MPPITDTRQRLIDAASELFWERGYAATGLSDIVDAAGARGGSLYHFFPAKDDLLLAVIDHHSRVIENTIENSLAATDEPPAKVLAVVEFYRRFMKRTGCSLGCPLTNLTGELTDTHPQAARQLAAFADRLVEMVAENLALAKGERIEDVRGTARAVVCMIQGALLQSRAAKSEVPMDECAAMVRSLLGIAADTPVVVRRGAMIGA